MAYLQSAATICLLAALIAGAPSVFAAEPSKAKVPAPSAAAAKTKLAAAPSPPPKRDLNGPPPLAASLVPAGDLPVYRNALLAAANGSIEQARTIARQSRNDVLMRLVDYTWIVRPGSPASFEDITNFQRAHSDWPSQELMRKRAEALLAEDASDRKVLDWYTYRQPGLGEAELRWGEALMRIGRVDEAEEAIRHGWITGTFSQKEEFDILGKYRQFLRPEDHVRRIDRLIWEEDRGGARRMLPRVDPDTKILAETRMALAELNSNADRMVMHVPPQLQNDPGLIYERARWRRQKGLDDDALFLLLREDAPKAYSEKWWVERQHYVRRAIQLGSMSDAYRLAASHGLSDTKSLSEAEWLSGWIALRYLADARLAVGHFVRMAGSVRAPVSVARGSYWAARAYEVIGEQAEALKWYGRAAEHAGTYYGQLALLRLGREQRLKIPDDPVPEVKDIEGFEGRELAKAALILAAINDRDRLRGFILRLSDTARSPSEHALVADFALKIGRRDLAVTAAKRAAQNGVSILRRAFPVVKELQFASEPEQALVLALARQESEFRTDAISKVGARGVMQLMPATALSAAKTLGVAFTPDRLTNDLTYNAKLGGHYLKTLVESYEGSYLLALAAYNAGPSRVQKWMQDWGDPRRADVDPLDWVELIPFSETRNYVQRVLEGVQVYRQLLKPDGGAIRQIETDLRGGARRQS